MIRSSTSDVNRCKQATNVTLYYIQNSLNSDSHLDSGKEGRRINNVCNCVGAKLKENTHCIILQRILNWNPNVVSVHEYRDFGHKHI